MFSYGNRMEIIKLSIFFIMFTHYIRKCLLLLTYKNLKSCHQTIPNTCYYF